ncbi:MAG: hypothetical protein MMC33_009133 [Icmadophila ericetorum]|nr:hypothetical protein [Icmadophila ericetorum]
MDARHDSLSNDPYFGLPRTLLTEDCQRLSQFDPYYGLPRTLLTEYYQNPSQFDSYYGPSHLQGEEYVIDDNQYEAGYLGFSGRDWARGGYDGPPFPSSEPVYVVQRETGRRRCPPRSSHIPPWSRPSPSPPSSSPPFDGRFDNDPIYGGHGLRPYAHSNRISPRSRPSPPPPSSPNGNPFGDDPFGDGSFGDDLFGGEAERRGRPSREESRSGYQWMRMPSPNAPGFVIGEEVDDAPRHRHRRRRSGHHHREYHHQGEPAIPGRPRRRY